MIGAIGVVAPHAAAGRVRVEMVAEAGGEGRGGEGLELSLDLSRVPRGAKGSEEGMPRVTKGWGEEGMARGATGGEEGVAPREVRGVGRGHVFPREIRRGGGEM